MSEEMQGAQSAMIPVPAEEPEMLTMSLGGVIVKMPSNLDDAKRKDFVAQLINSEQFAPYIDKEFETPSNQRMTVGSAPDEDKLANVRQFYPDAIPYGDDNFVFTNPETQRLTLFNPEGFEVGDVAEYARPIAEFAGGTLGAVAGATASVFTGPGAVVTGPAAIAVGAGVGTAVAGQLFDFGQSVFGDQIDSRNVLERTGQAVEDFAFGFAGQRIGDAAAVGVKKAFGGLKPKTNELIAKFRSLKITPPAGAVTQGTPTVAILEQASTRNVFSASVMQKNADKILSEIDTAADEVFRTFKTPLSAQETGTVIKEAAQGAADRFKETKEQLYTKAYDLIGAETPTPLNATVALRQELEQKMSNAPKLFDKRFGAAVRMLKNLEAVGAGKKIPGAVEFDTLRELRTDIGEELGNIASVNTTAPKAVLKKMYAAITQDLAEVAKLSGDDAAKAIDEADAYTREFNETATKTLDKILKLDADERAFKFATERLRDGGTRLQILRNQFEEAEWDQIGASVLGRIGKDADGVFDVNKFYREWRNMSGEAKDALFGGSRYKGMREQLDDIYDITSSLKGVERFANSSNTGTVLNVYNIFQVLGAGLVGLDVRGLATLAGFGAVSNLSARLITSEVFLKWLTTPIKDPSLIKPHLTRLTAIAAQNAELREPINEYLKTLATRGDDE
tara:strand:+ start:1532 stop:3565 length:2034 start_codon:yes stop_codon:yes gene_type:complete